MLERVAARMISSSDSWVGVGGSEEMRRDWWRRERARRGCEEGVNPADVRMGMRLVVSRIDFARSIRTCSG